jgi:uncharacterized protein (TIGR03437 family)
VLYAGASPLNSSGMFQIDALLPPDLPASPDTYLVVKIGGAANAGVAASVAIQ